MAEELDVQGVHLQPPLFQRKILKAFMTHVYTIQCRVGGGYKYLLGGPVLIDLEECEH